MPKARKDRSTLYKQLNEAAANLSRLQLSAQQAEQEGRQALRQQQVLISGILLLQEVLAFYARQQHTDAGAPGAAAAAGAADAACDTAAASSSGHAASYAARMLVSLSRQHIEETLEWSSADWCSFVRDTYALMASQLELLEREPAPGEQPNAVRITKRELQQAMEAWNRRMLVLTLYVRHIGPRVAGPMALNHVTNEHEMPPPHHWHAVVRRMRPSANQLAQLAAAYAEFQRLQAAVRAHALRLTSLLSSPNSCSLGVLLAVGGSHSRDDGSGSGSEGSGGSDGSGSGSSGSDNSGGNGGGGSDGDAHSHSGSCPAQPGARTNSGAEPAPASGADLDRLLAQHAPSTQLPVTFLGLFLLDTLSPQQLARMITASWPWVARPAPIAEAAAALWQEQRQQLDQPVSGLWVAERKEALADTAGETRRELLEHVRQRYAWLAAQHNCWWQQHELEQEQQELQEQQEQQEQQQAQQRDERWRPELQLSQQHEGQSA